MPVKVVNMIPNSLSNETNRDSEPNISVNPASPLQMAASAFTPDPLASGSGPIFVSTNGGDTWTLNVVLPGGNQTVDITLRFANASNMLYAGIIRSDAGHHLNILRKDNFLMPGLMTILVDRSGVDQPYVAAATVLGGSGAGQDRVYVGDNDFGAPSGRTSTLDVSLNAATAPAPAGFNPDRIETRATSGQDGPSVRPAIHLNGTIYAAYFGWRSASGSITTADVVVVRDDNWGSGATPFRALVDSGDGQPGVRVVTGVSIPWDTINNIPASLGTQRIGSHLTIAVDPTDSQTVYVAWADGTSGSNYTIHLRRSIDGGAHWSGDLRAVVSATNPGLAVNSHGKVGFLYQKLVNPGSGNRWETHFELSNDHFDTVASDTILANVPDNNGSYAGVNPIGDYSSLVAVGKNFYGVFSGNNTPDNANFPNNVFYQRNADFTTHTLLDLSSNPVAASIDPFFFKFTTVEIADDFYVRDWTDSPSSGDNGAEPSTHPVFYATSDVWNRRGTLAGPFTNDQPSNEDAGNGAGNIGDNWAFARIRRNAPAASGSQTVTAHFLVSRFGTGSPYVDAGSMDPEVSFPDPDPTVVFNAADVGPVTTDAYHWHLNPTSSSHLCLAVEISSPNDPFVAPSLVGNTPGWPTTDLRIVNDNNKAQRNMGLSTTPARGVGMSDTFYAIAHNAATFPRDMVLSYTASPDAQRRLEGATIEIIGGRGKGFKSGDTITLKNMQPGEDRWIGLTFNPPAGKEGEVVAVDFYELVGGIPVNGFAIGAQLASTPRAIRAAVELHRSVFTRLVYGFNSGEARAAVTAAERLLSGKGITEATYLSFLRDALPAADGAVRGFVKSQKISDPFKVSDALKRLTEAQGDADAACVAHTTLLNKLDSLITMQQLAAGDPASILHNVRWQHDLYSRLPQLAQLKCRDEVRAQSAEFISAYSARKLGNRQFPELIRALLGCFRQTADGVKDLNLAEDISAMQDPKVELAALQKAHRSFLLKLQGLAK